MNIEDIKSVVKQVTEETFDFHQLMVALNLTPNDLQGIDLSNLDLRGVDFSNADLSDANFSGSNLDQINFSGTNLTSVSFDEAKISNTNFNNSILKRTVFNNTELDSVTFLEVDFIITSFTDTEITRCTFKECLFEHAKLSHCFIEKSVISHTNLRYVDFSTVVFNYSDIEASNIKYSKLGTTHFIHCNIWDSRFINNPILGLKLESSIVATTRFKNLGIGNEKDIANLSVIFECDFIHILMDEWMGNKNIYIGNSCLIKKGSGEFRRHFYSSVLTKEQKAIIIRKTKYILNRTKAPGAPIYDNRTDLPSQIKELFEILNENHSFELSKQLKKS